jgi:MarR family transcriptional regulator, 2-MHQ and catechol-resistance regulon repressor
MEDYNSIHAKAYFNFLKTGSWIDERIKEALNPFNITHAQLNTLHILKDNHPNPVSANELKKRILVSNPDVTRLLDRLVKKGYVLRETCPENRRKVDISLTDTGIKLYDKAHHSAKQALGSFFEKKITEDEARELRRILHKIRE